MSKRGKKRRPAKPALPTSISRSNLLHVQDIGFAAFLAAVTFLIYVPSLRSDLVYDAHKEIIDEGFIASLSNLPAVLSLKVLGMNLMLADRPGHMLYLMLIAAVGGKEPFAFHLCSNLLHAINVGLLVYLMKALLGEENLPTTTAAKRTLMLLMIVTAMFFALHPLSVESVAEVSYSSSLLVTFFTLLALLAVALFRPDNRRMALLWGGLGVLCTFAAVTAKESGIVVPALLILYWFLYRRTETRRPWMTFLVAAAVASGSFLAARFYWARPEAGHPEYLGGSIDQVFLIQPRLWVFMMGQLVWPIHLSADYAPVEQLGPSVGVAVIVLLVVLVAQAWLIRSSRIGAMGVAMYWGGLATVSNFVPLFRPVADRFYYLSLAGASLQMLAILILMLPRPYLLWTVVTLLAAVSVPFTALTFKRQRAFANDFSLWTDTLAVSPMSPVAHAGLGWALYQKGETDEAIGHYRRALEMNANMPEAYNNLGMALYQKGQWDDAVTQYQKAQVLEPDTAQIPNNIGLAWAQEGKLEDAVFQYRKALSINPSFVEAHNNLGMVFAQQGQLEEATVQYGLALATAPNQAETHNNLAIALARQGKLQQAIDEFQKAVLLNPDYATAQDNLTKATQLLQQKEAHR